MGTPALFDWIGAFDPKTCSPEVAKAAREMIKDLTEEKIRKVSQAAAALFLWVSGWGCVQVV